MQNPYTGIYANPPLYVAGGMPGYGYAYHPTGMMYPVVPMEYMVDSEKTEEGMNAENGNATMQPHWQVYAPAHIEQEIPHPQSDEPGAAAAAAAVSIHLEK